MMDVCGTPWRYWFQSAPIRGNTQTGSGFETECCGDNPLGSRAAFNSARGSGGSQRYLAEVASRVARQVAP